METLGVAARRSCKTWAEGGAEQQQNVTLGSGPHLLVHLRRNGDRADEEPLNRDGPQARARPQLACCKQRGEVAGQRCSEGAFIHEQSVGKSLGTAALSENLATGGK